LLLPSVGRFADRREADLYAGLAWSPFLWRELSFSGVAHINGFVIFLTRARESIFPKCAIVLPDDYKLFSILSSFLA